MIQQVSAHIERFSGLRFQWLIFSQPLEDRFEADTAPRRSARLALEGLLAITIFDFFLLIDRLVVPGEFHHALIVRLAIFTPLALAFDLLLWRNPRTAFRESGITLMICVAGLSLLYLNAGNTAVNSAYKQAGLLAVIVYANTSVRLRFPYSLAASAVLFAGDLVFLHTDRLLQSDQKLVGLALTLAMIAVTLIANYSANREERLNYLLALRGDLLVEDLHHSNERLADVAETDGLTGLINRTGFDVRFERRWKEAFENQTPLSVIMVDVDHFKQTNDNYGHLYGDKVLKRIAHLVLEALRKEDDSAARFGGEEFVILLPRTDEPAAMLVAERLRRLIEVAGFPPIEVSRLAFGPITATVSCGVATTIPKTLEKRSRLINAADRALYEAKAGGRNRVCCATYKSNPSHAVTQAASRTLSGHE